MSAPLYIPGLLREWKICRAYREIAVEKDDGELDGAEASKAIDTFQADAKAIIAAVMEAEHAAFTIADVTALVSLAIHVAEDEVGKANDAMPLIRKARRVLKALRDGSPQPEPEAATEDGSPIVAGTSDADVRLAVSNALLPVEDKLGDFSALLRLMTAKAVDMDIYQTGLKGMAHEREVQLRNDVIAGFAFVRDQAEALEQFYLELRWEALDCIAPSGAKAAA